MVSVKNETQKIRAIRVKIILLDISDNVRQTTL